MNHHDNVWYQQGLLLECFNQEQGPSGTGPLRPADTN